MVSTTKIVQSDGVSISTEAFGDRDDTPVLLLMGATASMLGWPDALCTGLSDRSRFVIRFDHRDTGESTTVAPGEATYFVEDMAGDLVSVMDGYGLERVHLVGMSLGGYLAQMISLTAPERVLSLTLIASEPLGWDGEPLPSIDEGFLAHFGGMSDLDWTDEVAVENFLVGIERLCAGTGAGFPEDQARERIRQVMSRTDSLASMFNHAGLVVREDWTGAFRKIGVPTLVVHGEEDPVLPLPNGRALADGIVGAHLVALPRVGHELPTRALPRIIDEVIRHTAAHPA